MIGRIVRRILHRLIRGLVLHPIRGVLLLVAALAAAAVFAFQGFQSAPGFSLGMPSLSLGGAGGAPSATENYLKGNSTYNAELMWSALGEEAVQRFRSRGGSVQTLQAQMEQAKQAGVQLEQINYVGGQTLADGTSMHFYVVLTRGPRSRGEVEYVPYTFTLDPSGKISRVQ
jgi:hypothetical protein